MITDHPPETIAKATRILVASFALIAESIRVPVGDLVALVPVLDLAGDPGREADEAEIEEHDDEGSGEETLGPGGWSDDGGSSAQVQPPEPPSAERFTLKDPSGARLHQHKRGLTRLPGFFWIGSADDVRELKRKLPRWRELKAVPA